MSLGGFIESVGEDAAFPWLQNLSYSVGRLGAARIETQASNSR